MLAWPAFWLAFVSHMRNILYLLRCNDPVVRPSKLHVHSVDVFEYKNMSTAKVFSSAFAHRAHLNVTGYWIVRVHFPSL